MAYRQQRRYLTGEAFGSLEEAQAAMIEPDTTITLDEGQRQMVLLALALTSVKRPGLIGSIEQIAMKMDNRNEEGKPAMFTRLRELNTP